MSDQQPDYDALAKKFGAVQQQEGQPDYDALAAKFGAIGGSSVSGGKTDLPIDWQAVAQHASAALPALGAAGAVMAGPPGWISGLAAAGLGGAAGEAANQLIERGIAPEQAPQTSLEAAQRIGKEAGINMAAEGVGRIASNIVGAVAGRLPGPQQIYQSILKPRGSLEEAREIAATGLREGIMPGEIGLARTGQLINEINQQVIDGITARQRMGLTIDPNTVAQRLDAITAKYDNTLDRDQARAVVNDVKRRLSEGLAGAKPAQPTGLFDASGNPIVAPATQAQPIPIERAQAIKQAEGQIVRSTYGKPTFDVTIEDKARQQLVRGLKEEIESVFPEVKGLNERESKLIDLEGALKDYVKREGNKSSGPVRGMLLGVATGHPVAGAIAGGLRGVLDDPALSIRLGRALNTAGKRAGQVSQAVSPVINLPNIIRAAQTWTEVPKTGTTP